MTVISLNGPQLTFVWCIITIRLSYSFLAEAPQKRCAVPLGASHLGAYDAYLPYSWWWRCSNCLIKGELARFFNCNVFPFEINQRYFETMQNILCLIYCTAHPQRQGLLASSLGVQRQSANHRVGGQHIFVKGLNLTANHSLASASDICGEDTQLINITQRRRPDISASLTGFVNGQCSVIMNIWKIDWTQCMEISHLLLPSPLLLGDVEGHASSPTLYCNPCDAFVINGWQLAS